jgi:hypothetical protein
VQVLHQQDEHLLLAAPLDQPAQRLEDPPHAHLGRQLGGGLGRVGHLEEVEEERKVVAKARVEVEHPPGHLLPGLGRLVVGDTEIIPQQGEDGQQGHLAAMGDSAGPAHRDTAGGGRAGELLAQPALADSGLAHDTHHLGVALRGHGQGVFQHGQLPVSRDQGNSPQGPAAVQDRRRGSRPLQGIGP